MQESITHNYELTETQIMAIRETYRIQKRLGYTSIDYRKIQGIVNTILDFIPSINNIDYAILSMEDK